MTAAKAGGIPSRLLLYQQNKGTGETMQKHALLTNDDGFYAPGIKALREGFLAAGWRVTVSAPDEQRSAASHSITIKRPLVATRVKSESPAILYQVDGMPADCVKLALHELMDDRPDIVVSGINDGWNAGTDIHYSGTVGAAMEAAFEGVPAIAVSSAFSSYGADAARYENAARLAVTFADKLIKAPLPMPSVLNLNVPRCHPADIKGIVEAPLSLVEYSDAYDRLERTGRSAAYWIKGEIVEEVVTPGGDLDYLLQGYVTVTAVGWDLTMRGACAGLL